MEVVHPAIRHPLVEHLVNRGFARTMLLQQGASGIVAFNHERDGTKLLREILTVVTGAGVPVDEDRPGRG
jgi:hypothetical protein